MFLTQDQLSFAAYRIDVRESIESTDRMLGTNKSICLTIQGVPKFTT